MRDESRRPGEAESNRSFLSNLSVDEQALVRTCVTVRKFGRGIFIFHKDSPGQTLYIIESGRVRTFILSEAGQEITLNVYGPGEALGELSFLDSLPRSEGAVTMTATTVLALRREDFFSSVAEHPELALRMMSLLTHRLRDMTSFVESLAFLDVNGRVAMRLLDLADRFGLESDDGPGEVVALKLTQAELASWVVSSRETVNKVLCSYRDRRWIDLADQKITILDRRGLRQQAGR